MLYVAGKPPIDNLPTEIMFVATSVQEEEAAEVVNSMYGMKFKQAAEYLKGPIGDMFKDVCARAGIDIRKCWYTAMVKWLLPRAMRSKPATKVLKWGMPILLDEIKKAKPKIIVCLGKPAFDQLSDTKIGFDDATGGWFWSSKAEAHIYVMRSPTELLMKPELFEGFRVDLVEVKRKLDLINGTGDIADLPVRTQVIRSASELRDWVAQMQEEGHKLFSVDGEWHGNTHIDGDLRSLQLAWTDSDAIYIRFRNDQNEWDFDLDHLYDQGEAMNDAADAYCGEQGMIPHESRGGKTWMEGWKKGHYAEVGKILQPLLNQPDVKYVGHHYVADALWMAHWLGLEVLSKCYMDTEFAQQTIDEASELKLERGISMKYTTLGRYDIDLILWKKANKALCEDGYGYIPDPILIPYACRDVLAVFRAVPMIRKQMHFQKLENYYDTIFGPFVTDVFYTFSEVGLPMDIPLMDELRELFNFAKRELDREFRQKVFKDAKTRLMAKLIEVLGATKIAQAMAITRDIVALVADGHHEQAWTQLKADTPLDQVVAFRALLDHLIISPDFNIRSAPDMRRWLFDVSGMTPIKSTNQKSKGMPSMDWSKVLELDKNKQALYTPACDKQTLQILAEKLPLVDELLDLNVVGNICKAFLKEPEVYFDEELDEEVEEEAGLHKWLASNGRIHGQTSTTETGRPRGWRPNSLNWPSYVNKRIGKAMARVIMASVKARDIDMPNEERIAKGLPLPLPDSLMKWAFIKSEKDIPSIRSIVKAPTGWVLCEADYRTAEIRGLAFISGDENLIRLMTEADPEWAFARDGDQVVKVRVAYTDFKDSGIPANKQDEKYFLGTWEDGKLIKQYTEDDLIRDEQTGEVVHCSYDLHWSLAEWTYAKPREEMKDKVERAAAKVEPCCSMLSSRAKGSSRRLRLLLAPALVLLDDLSLREALLNQVPDRAVGVYHLWMLLLEPLRSSANRILRIAAIQQVHSPGHEAEILARVVSVVVDAVEVQPLEGFARPLFESPTHEFITSLEQDLDATALVVVGRDVGVLLAALLHAAEALPQRGHDRVIHARIQSARAVLRLALALGGEALLHVPQFLLRDTAAEVALRLHIEVAAVLLPNGPGEDCQAPNLQRACAAHKLRMRKRIRRDSTLLRHHEVIA